MSKDILAVAVAYDTRFRISREGDKPDNGLIESFTENGWQPFHTFNAHDQSKSATVLFGLEELHLLYGYDINEVNLNGDNEDFSVGVEALGINRLNEHSAVRDASINYVGDEM